MKCVSEMDIHRDLCLTVGKLQLPNDWIKVSYQMGYATAYIGQILCAAVVSLAQIKPC